MKLSRYEKKLKKFRKFLNYMAKRREGTKSLQESFVDELLSDVCHLLPIPVIPGPPGPPGLHGRDGDGNTTQLELELAAMKQVIHQLQDRVAQLEAEARISRGQLPIRPNKPPVKP